ncbi:MAG: carbohydrate-binding protein [Kibdelosporangium sp.]
MRRRLKLAVSGIGSCAAAALVATLLLTRSDDTAGAQIVVPEEQDTEVLTPASPTSPVIVLPKPSPDSTTSASTPVPPSSTRARPTSSPPPPPPPAPAPPRTPLRSAGVDFQAENASIRGGTVESNHAGFTGSGFVDYTNARGSSVEWTVTALATTAADVTFRFANDSSTGRPMDITVNGIRVTTLSFPRTNGWEDWRTVTVRVNLLAGTSRIKATATTGDGGPNVDKITVS